ncbi:hypothetical protein JHK87_050243 [Glycine soja]|nr:hypothetical protein JHK87_050243 [Glycine soja]
MEEQPNTNPRRQSTRNRPLTVKALESLGNEFLHVQRRQKKKDILPHIDAFSPCRKARTSKTNLHSHSSDHGTAVLAKEKHFNGDHKVEILRNSKAPIPMDKSLEITTLQKLGIVVGELKLKPRSHSLNTLGSREYCLPHSELSLPKEL